MEMYANTSSFETNLTLQTRNSFRDVSFSSYLNKDEENMIRKLANQASDLSNAHHCRMKSEDDELDVFGAEKYFKGEIENKRSKNDLRFVDSSEITSKMHEKLENFDAKQTKIHFHTHTPSVRSNVSCNSRTELLHKQQSPGRKIETGGKNCKTTGFLATFRCNCMNKKSTQINEKRFIRTTSTEISKPHTRTLTLNFDQNKKDQLLCRSTETKTRNNYFTFPVLNSYELNSNSSSNSKSGNLAGKVQRLNNGDWDNDNPTEDVTYSSSSRVYNNDEDSDSSSDLFEIESLSTTGNSSILGHRKSESNGYAYGYAPSEVSVDWSVVTASAADFSVVYDYEDVRTGGESGPSGDGWRVSGGNGPVTEKNYKDGERIRVGVISGCTSNRAVSVVEDGCKVGGGGAAGGRRRSPESMA